MRIGLISDIHADLDGLVGALALLDGLGVEAILCAGDLVERGHGGDAVIELVRARAISCVKGNHEYITLFKQEAVEREGDPGGLGFRPLTAGSIDYLRALPDRLRLSFEGTPLLLAHATPWDDFTFVYPESRPGLYRRVAEAAQADFVVLGHTHVPMLAQVGATWIANPGSVSAAGSRTCAVLSIPDGAFQVFLIPDGTPVNPIARLSL